MNKIVRAVVDSASNVIAAECGEPIRMSIVVDDTLRHEVDRRVHDAVLHAIGWIP